MMSDTNEIELRTWADEIYKRLLMCFTRLTSLGVSHVEAMLILKPMIEYLSKLDAELVNAG